MHWRPAWGGRPAAVEVPVPPAHFRQRACCCFLFFQAPPSCFLSSSSSSSSLPLQLKAKGAPAMSACSCPRARPGHRCARAWGLGPGPGWACACLPAARPLPTPPWPGGVCVLLAPLQEGSHLNGSTFSCLLCVPPIQHVQGQCGSTDLAVRSPSLRPQRGRMHYRGREGTDKESGLRYGAGCTAALGPGGRSAAEVHI